MKFFFETYIFGIILHEEFKEGKGPSGDKPLNPFGSVKSMVSSFYIPNGC